MPNIELIIFDFDGVIADSEHLFIKADRAAFAHAGIAMSEYDMTHRFIGMDDVAIGVLLKKEFGAERTEIYFEHMQKTVAELIEQQLTAIPHVAEFLENTHLPYYVATNGTTQMTRHKIEILGITHLFDDVIIGTDSVAKPKPAPDMFKLAADKANTAYDKCMVIEDGIYGIAAAKSLNMTPIGFVGARHTTQNHAKNLSLAGAILTFDDMRELPTIIKEI